MTRPVDTLRAQIVAALAEHPPGRASRDSYDYWRRHCAGCRWAGSPWETRAQADTEHRGHQADAVLSAIAAKTDEQ